MASKDHYILERVLLDVTVTQLVAGTTIQSLPAATRTVGNSTIQPTTNSITSSGLQATQVADALHVYAIPPRAADGTFPDAEFWFHADGADLRNYQIFNVQADHLMCPAPFQVARGSVDALGKPTVFKLGESTRKVLWDAVNGKPTPNMPLKITGIKYLNELTVSVRSIAGWANTAPVPLRIIVTGELLDDDQLAALASGYDGRVYLQHMQRVVDGKDPLSFIHDIGGPVGRATWAALPGGPKQLGKQIHRFARWGANAAATGASAAFPMTNYSDLRGGATNVGPAGNNADSDHDLGFNTPRTKDAFWLRGFGVRVDPTAATAANWAYAGWQVDGDVIPSGNGEQGFVSRLHVNPFQFGSVQPQRPESNLYTLIPRYPGELLVHGEGAVPVIAANGTALGAGAAVVAIDGTYIKGAAA